MVEPGRAIKQAGELEVTPWKCGCCLNASCSMSLIVAVFLRWCHNVLYAILHYLWNLSMPLTSSTLRQGTVDFMQLVHHTGKKMQGEKVKLMLYGTEIWLLWVKGHFKCATEESCSLTTSSLLPVKVKIFFLWWPLSFDSLLLIGCSALCRKG